MVTAVAQAATRNGADWVIAIDADEFWWTPTGSLHEVVGSTDAGALVASVDNFVQSLHVVRDHPASLTTMWYCAETKGDREDAKRLVEEGEIAFVEMANPPKLALRPTAELAIGTGNHTATGFAGDLRATTELVVLHAPIRARDRFRRQSRPRAAICGRAREPGVGWHLRRIADMEAEALDAEWAANSQQFGALTVNGSRHRLVPDDRLRNSVMPFVSRSARLAGSIRARYARPSSANALSNDSR